MASNFPLRNFNCKDEELPVICRFAAYSLKRDLADFSAFSPKFNEDYVNQFESRIAEISDLVEPKSETAQLKIITERLHASMSGLLLPLNRLNGYITIARQELKITPADFGITAIRKSINSKDAEGVIKALHLILGNIDRNKELLAAHGLQADLVNLFAESASAISADKQTSYEVQSNRKTIVQNNLGKLNALSDQLSEILNIGKILFKGIDVVKQQEYTFNELKKRVRKTQTASTDKTDTNEANTNPSTTVN